METDLDDVNSTFLGNMVNKQRFGNPHNDDSRESSVSGDAQDEDESPHPATPPRASTPCENAPESHQITESSLSVFEQKKACLVEIRELKSKGAHFNKVFTFEDDLNKMKHALEMARIDIMQNASEVRNKAGVKTARRILLAAVSMLEFLTTKWNPLNLQLNGFGEYVMGNIDDYDNIFERLIAKWSGRGTMEPEFELLLTLGTSAVMYHISNKFLSNAFPEPTIVSSEPNPPATTTDINRFDDEDDE